MTFSSGFVLHVMAAFVCVDNLEVAPVLMTAFLIGNVLAFSYDVLSA